MKKVGIVGCGSIANSHSMILRDFSDVKLCAFVDIKIERAEDFSIKYGEEGSRYYRTIEEMVKDIKLDCVHICTPHYLHVPMAKYLLEEGLSVFMEKPPAIELIEFEELLKIEKDSLGTVGVCFQNRYNPTTEKTIELLNERKIGKLTGARAFLTWNRDKEYYINNDWKGRYSTEGGGVLINQAIHTIDLLRLFIGTPKSVEVRMINHRLKEYIEVEDTFLAFINFENINANIYATNSYSMDAPVIIELAGEEGRLRIEEDTITIFYNNGNKEILSFNQSDCLGKSYWGNSHETCIKDFYYSLINNYEYKNNLFSTYETFSLVMDIYEAGKTESVIFCKECGFENEGN